MSCVIYRVTWRGTRLALKKIRVFFNRWMGCLPKFLSLDPSWMCVEQFFQNSEKSVRGAQILESCAQKVMAPELLLYPASIILSWGPRFVREMEKKIKKGGRFWSCPTPRGRHKNEDEGNLMGSSKNESSRVSWKKLSILLQLQNILLAPASTKFLHSSKTCV